ncbi:MAG: hypothetical protein AAF488_14610 [Planctomycetota bacterium]
MGENAHNTFRRHRDEQIRLEQEVVVGTDDPRCSVEPGGFRGLLWGRNLLDKEFGLSGQTELQPLGADETQIFGEPRTYGITLTYQF